MDRPITTLFMLSSVDGKISTGNNDYLDVDKDFPKIKGIRDGLKQYYEIEQTTDLYSLNSGRVLEKIGSNNSQKNIIKLPVSFLVIDNKPHLNDVGVNNLLKKSKKLYIITTNKFHPAFSKKNAENLEIIYYERTIDFYDLFKKLKKEYNIDRLTIQTGGTLNSIFLRMKLIDKLSLVLAPTLIGGNETSSLIDGKSLSSVDDLQEIKALKLIEVKKLNDSYIHLIYDIINDTVIE